MPLLTNTYTANVSVRLPAIRRENVSCACARDVEPAADDEHVQHHQHEAADEAPLLADHREDEIGRALRQEFELRLAAVHVALAEHAARADRDLRLDRVIAGAERVVLRVQEREHALPLVVVQEMPGDGHGRDEQRAEAEDVAQLQAGEQDHEPAARRRPAAPCRGPAARRSAASAPARSATTMTSVVKSGGSGRSCRYHAQHERHRDLHELGRLEAHEAEVEPALRAHRDVADDAPPRPAAARRSPYRNGAPMRMTRGGICATAVMHAEPERRRAPPGRGRC